MLHWIRSRFNRPSPPFDRSAVIMEDDVNEAVCLLASYAYNEQELRYLAGVLKLYDLPAGLPKTLWRQARNPMYKLAAVKVLAEQGKWDVPILRAYAWTGYQKLLLPSNPLFAAIAKGSGPIERRLQGSELKIWLHEAEDCELHGVKNWYQQEVKELEPALHEAWIHILGELGPTRLSHIQEVVVRRSVVNATLADAIEEYVSRTVRVSTTGTIEAEPLFAITLDEPGSFSGVALTEETGDSVPTEE